MNIIVLDVDNDGGRTADSTRQGRSKRQDHVAREKMLTAGSLSVKVICRIGC